VGTFWGLERTQAYKTEQKHGTAGYRQNNLINELRTADELRTRGSWVQILPGAPYSEGLAKSQALFICAPGRAHSLGRGSPLLARQGEELAERPLSPLLSNILLADLDRELEARTLCFCRYADDCNIYVRSERAGVNLLRSLTGFLEDRLKLKVNQAKSAVARPWLTETKRALEEMDGCGANCAASCGGNGNALTLGHAT